MRIIEKLLGTSAVMTQECKFFEVKTVEEIVGEKPSRDGKSTDNITKKTALYREIRPSYQNELLEIFEIERGILSPWYFAVEMRPDGSRKLLPNVFNKKFHYEIKMIGATDFAYGWKGRLDSDGLPIQCSGDGYHWSVISLNSDGCYVDISSQFLSVNRVRIASVWLDGEVLYVKAAADNANIEEPRVAYLKQNGEYVKILQEEVQKHWSNICKGEQASSWRACDEAEFENLADYLPL